MCTSGEVEISLDFPTVYNIRGYPCRYAGLAKYSPVGPVLTTHSILGTGFEREVQFRAVGHARWPMATTEKPSVNSCRSESA